MQVVCGNCQLSFEAPDGATGLVCPICRNPLLAPAAADGGDKKLIDWNGGTLDDLIALVTAPAVSARVEVLPATGDTVLGEVHLLAGGVSDALYGGKSSDDALDRLRAVVPARFRVEPRLPSPADGNLSVAGPLSGTLDGRPLAHLMRYCEDYVITCTIEVWRGNETARVEYRRGEINGVTVGGIDAPERLAEVMQWASGNYRLIVPPLSLPAVAPKRPLAAAAAPAPVPAPSAQAARQSSATKTMFGFPLSEVTAARAAAEATTAGKGATAGAAPAAAAPAPAPAPAQAGHAPAPAPAPVSAAASLSRPPAASPAVLAAPSAPAAPLTLTPPGVAPSAVPSPLAASRASATKTIFGVPAPKVPDGFVPGRPTPAVHAAQPAAAAESAAAESDAARAERKTGARKVAVPAPEIVRPNAPGAAAAAAARTTGAVTVGAGTGSGVPAAVDVGRATHHGYDSARVPVAVNKKAAVAEKTQPTRVAPSRSPQTPIWTYVGIGFTFGLALLSIYQLVGRLAH